MFEPPDERRAERLAEIRRQIEAGDYITPARLETAVDAWLDAYRGARGAATHRSVGQARCVNHAPSGNPRGDADRADCEG